MNPAASLTSLGAGKKGKNLIDPSKKKLGGLAGKEEKMPHEIAEVDMSVLSEVKTQQLYQWYCEI